MDNSNIPKKCYQLKLAPNFEGSSEIPNSLLVSWHELDEQNEPTGGPGALNGYRVEYEKLLDLAVSSRKDLDQLVVALSSPDKAALIPETVQQVAKAGKAIADALFGGAIDADQPDADIDQEGAEYCRDWFEKTIGNQAVGSCRLEVLYSELGTFDPLPWALIWTGDDVASEDCLNHFWGYKFALLCGLDRDPLNPNEREWRPKKGSTSVVAILEGLDVLSKFSGEREGLSSSPEIRDEHRKEVIKHPESLADLLGEKSRSDLFWYANLNPNSRDPNASTRLIPKESFNEYVASRNRFAMEDSDISTPPLVFLFLDGDAVIRSDRGAKFLSEIMNLSVLGLIAVETDIFDIALRFKGWDFWKSVVRAGCPLDEAARRTRHDFGPAGLLYGVYSRSIHAYPDASLIDIVDQIDPFLKLYVELKLKSQASVTENGAIS